MNFKTFQIPYEHRVALEIERRFELFKKAQSIAYTYTQTGVLYPSYKRTRRFNDIP